MREAASREEVGKCSLIISKCLLKTQRLADEKLSYVRVEKINRLGLHINLRPKAELDTFSRLNAETGFGMRGSPSQGYLLVTTITTVLLLDVRYWKTLNRNTVFINFNQTVNNKLQLYIVIYRVLGWEWQRHHCTHF